MFTKNTTKTPQYLTFVLKNKQMLVCLPAAVLLCATGGAGEKLLMPGTGFLTVGAASTLAFCQVLREEYPEVPCKLNQVRLSDRYSAVVLVVLDPLP